MAVGIPRSPAARLRRADNGEEFGDFLGEISGGRRDLPRRGIRARRFRRARSIRDQLFLVTTTSRYSLGTTSVPSSAVLNLPRSMWRSASSASRASGSIAAKAFKTGP